MSDQEPLAVITAYATGPAPWGQLDPDLLEWLASGVAAVLLHGEETQRLRTESRQLKQELTSRATIDQAKGIVMAQGNCDADEAIDRLKEVSRMRNAKLREVARILVAQVQGGRRSS
ncbi:MAG: ANTAR domain-containing response regulator [Nocardioidaceae bacterium]